MSETMFRRFISIPVKKLDPRARLPQPAHPGDVGFDLYTLDKCYIPSGSTVVIPTGLVLCDFLEPEIQDGRIVSVAFMKIEGRSGLASQGVFPVGGIIDSSYRGEIKVVLHNGSDVCHILDPSRAVAQLVIYKSIAHVDTVHVVRFLESDTVTTTERGDEGLGSTDPK